MHKLHILEQNVFKLEVALLGDEGLFADPHVSLGPSQVDLDLLPTSELFGRSDDAN